MTGGGPEDGKAETPPWQDPAGFEAWAKDWITLWQSELTAMAADRELREGWGTLMALWARAATSAASQAASQMAGAASTFRSPVPHERPSRSAPADAAARPAPGAAASDAGGDEIERLHRRIAALEERLRAIERGSQPG